MKVLIVSPHFPPTNAPDHHRVRMLLPYLESYNIQAHVLCLHEEDVVHPCDPLLLKTVPADIPVTRIRAVPLALTTPLGLRSTALRSYFSLARAGTKLLERENFDLIFFSTTMFLTMALGPKWQKRFSVPYGIDIQDPWIASYYKDKQRKPPGGWLKYSFAQFTARYAEPKVMRKTSFLISVSQQYIDTLQERYSRLRSIPCRTIRFGANVNDYELLEREVVQQNIFSSSDNLNHWSYVGRGGTDMAPAAELLFAGLAQLRSVQPELLERVRFHFVGTCYEQAGQSYQTIAPLAQRFGLSDIVFEVPERIPYFEALQVLRDSVGLILIGSDDSSYSASKTYPYILAKRPLLAIVKQDSVVAAVLKQCNAGAVVEFSGAQENSSSVDDTESVLTDLLTSSNIPQTDWNAFREYSAEKMAEQVSKLFLSVVGQ